MPLLPKPITALTQQELLDLLTRLFPPHYLEPLKQIGPGYEILQAYAKLFARISLSVERLGNDAQIATAGTGSVASGTVEFYRDNANVFDTDVTGQRGTAASIVSGAGAGNMRVSGLTNMSAASVGHYLVISEANVLANNGAFLIAAFVSTSSVDVVNASASVPDANNGSIVWRETRRDVTVKAGTVVTTSHGGRDFVTLSDAFFSPSALGPVSVPVQAAAMGYEYNVRGQVTAADGTVLAGDIDTIKVLVEDPALGDPTIKVRNINPTTGGSDAALDALGRDRGVAQAFGEDSETYRNRLRQLPDTVSPKAIARAVEAALRPYSAAYQIIETFRLNYQTCYDAPPNPIAGTTYNPNIFAYDDPGNYPEFRNRWMDENDYRGGTIVVVPNLQPIRDYGMAYDDAAMTPAALASPDFAGQRAANAYDVPASVGFGVLQGAYDGLDVVKQSLYKSLYETLQAIKPGGSSVALELEGE